MNSNRSTTLFSESVSIVSSILSNGISITSVRIGIIKSNTFIEYIGHLIYVWKGLGLNTNQICLFMDTSPVHWTKMWKNFWGRMNWHAYFYYSTRQTWHLLSCFSANWREWYEAKGATLKINLKKNSGKQILAEVVKSIDIVSVMKIWQHFVLVLKQLVGEIYSDLNSHI